jgi:hypothetical protein
MSTETIELTNVGPIEHLSVPLPEGGGITVFRGRNDSGKSLSIGATERLCGSDVKLSQRDGSEEAGSIIGLGMTFRVGQTTRGKGELLATSIAGKLNIGDLIDPGIKDVMAADRARTKALCKLLGVEANPELFREALGYPPVIEGTDIVEMQRQLKVRCDEKALELERQANHAEGQSQALSDVSDDIDLDAESDADVLQAALEDAIKEESSISTHRAEGVRREREAIEATDRIYEAKDAYSGPSVDEASTGLAEADKTRSELSIAATEASEAYQQAERASVIAGHTHSAAINALTAAESHSKAMAGWKETIQASTADYPEDDDVNAAKHAVDAARENADCGFRIREHKANAEQAKRLAGEAKEHHKGAEELRKAGKATEKVLATVVDADTLTLKGGRWMTEVPGRGSVPYHERSRGVRAALALDLAARRAREMEPEGMVVIPFPQEVWEGLDPENRAHLAVQAKRLNVNLITAESAAGDIRCEVFKEA